VTVKTYLLSFPERLIRGALGLGAGVAREVGEVALPDGIRHSQLYQNLVDATLRFLIEQVGGVEGVYDAEGTLPDNFLARRTAGNAVEMLGIVAFRASAGTSFRRSPTRSRRRGSSNRTPSSSPSIKC
jgi:hypothetical protein